MLLLKFIRTLCGYVKFRITGDFCERFINLARTRRVRLWGLTRVSSRTMTGFVRARAFKRLRSVRRDSGVHIEILQKRGAPFTLRRYRRRAGLAAGGAIFLGLVFAMSCFIWSIEINGEGVDDAAVLDCLEKHGLREGAFAGAVNTYALSQYVMLEVDGVAFCSVRIEGSCAAVQVAPATPAPDRVESTQPCNIVAARDGVIVQIQVLEGTPAVAPGDAVLRGDLLANGVLDSDKVGMRLVHAAARVWARTHREIECFVPYETSYVGRTGKSHVNYRLRLFNFYINFYFGSGTKYEQYDKIEEIGRVRIGRFVFPIALVRQTWYETRTSARTLSPDAAENAALLALEQRQTAELCSALTQLSEVTVVRADDGVTATGRYACIEDIAAESAIEAELPG